MHEPFLEADRLGAIELADLDNRTWEQFRQQDCPDAPGFHPNRKPTFGIWQQALECVGWLD
jgi:hypothetical protein